MTVTAVVGANWGDEGKGRMVDALAEDHDIVVRFAGGGNAGHTVITPQGKFVLHLLPSGSLRPDKLNVLGPGVALDAKLLQKELAGLAERGVTPQLLVSDRAQLLLDHHRRLDQYEEARLGARSKRHPRRHGRAIDVEAGRLVPALVGGFVGRLDGRARDRRSRRRTRSFRHRHDRRATGG